MVALLVLMAAVAADAHTATYATKLSIHASDLRLSFGEHVRFSGHVSSPRARCEGHSTVKLVKVGAGVMDEAETNADGRYAFEIAGPRGDWRVRFPGKVLSAVGSHDHTCEGSRSRKLAVRVLG